MEIHFKEYSQRISAQQYTILKTLEDARGQNSTRGPISLGAYNSLKPFLKSLYDALLNHFQWQKSKFWEILVDFYADNPKADKKIEYLQSLLRETKIATLDFMDRHPAGMGDLNHKTFHVDFAGFSENITAYINEEQRYLNPLIEDLKISL